MSTTSKTQAGLKDLTTEELHEYGTLLDSVTPLENELLHRLEYYIQMYGDYLGSYTPSEDY